MKKTSSLVWRFFDRLQENNRCIAVLCKLCDTQYKYFGNTTNLRTHLVNKHPIQWDLLQNGTLDESSFRTYGEDENTNQTSISSPRPKRRKYVKSYKNDNVRYSVSVDLNKNAANRNENGGEAMPVIAIQRVDVLENSDVEHDNADDSDLLVRQMHNSRGSDEEWLEEDMYRDNLDNYEPQRKKVKVKHIKREAQSPTHRRSNYVVHTPKNVQKTERILVDNSLRKDEYSIFGDYVANKLRKYKGQQTRSNIQQLITTILWQAEYGMYDNMEAVKRIILHSVQEMVTEQPQEQEHQVQEVQEIQEIHSQDAQVQMVIEHRDDPHVTKEAIRIIDQPSE